MQPDSNPQPVALAAQQPVRVRCTGIETNGKRCKTRTALLGGKCARHHHSAEAAVPASQKKVSAKTQKTAPYVVITITNHYYAY